MSYATDVSITTISDLLPVLNNNTFADLPNGAVIIEIVKGSAHRATLLCNKLSGSYGAALIISFYSQLNGKFLRIDNGVWGE